MPGVELKNGISATSCEDALLAVSKIDAPTKTLAACRIALGSEILLVIVTIAFASSMPLLFVAPQNTPNYEVKVASMRPLFAATAGYYVFACLRIAATRSW